MKKIMFNNKYGLTEAVLSKRKTQTRRVINLTDTDNEYLDTAFDWGLRESVIIDRYAKYKVGEVVAVAESYKTISLYGGEFLANMMQNETAFKIEYCGAGWNNKMFVKSELMPNHIRITNIRVERLQDISDEDCIREGIEKFIIGRDEMHYVIPNYDVLMYRKPQAAFAKLIDKVSGKGTWYNNPFVFVYEFELIN